MTYKTEKEAKRACKELQKLMRLQDWETELNFVHPGELGNDAAQVQAIPLLKQATILLMDPKYDKNRPHLSDLVHELIHFHFVSFYNPEPGTLEHTLFEQAIVSLENTIYELLIKCKHPSCPKEARNVQP